jgi:hypothetical protein
MHLLLLLAASDGDSTAAAATRTTDVLKLDLPPRAMNRSGLEEAECTWRPYFRRLSLISSYFPRPLPILPYFRRPSLHMRERDRGNRSIKMDQRQNSRTTNFDFAALKI